MGNNKPPSSCLSPAATSMSAGESSWATHIANFLASPPRGGDEDVGQEAAASDRSFLSSSGFSSSSFITSELMCDDDEEEDECLQDTACSSAAGPKITSMENVDMKSKITMDAKEFQQIMPQLAKNFIDVGSRQQATNVHQEAINGQAAVYECNELRKKGLCLVPISMLIDYLG